MKYCGTAIETTLGEFKASPADKCHDYTNELDRMKIDNHCHRSNIDLASQNAGQIESLDQFVAFNIKRPRPKIIILRELLSSTFDLVGTVSFIDSAANNSFMFLLSGFFSLKKLD